MRSIHKILLILTTAIIFVMSMTAVYGCAKSEQSRFEALEKAHSNTIEYVHHECKVSAYSEEAGDNTPQPAEPTNIGSEDTRKEKYVGNFIVTAYTAGYESCGKHPGDPGYGITATGTRVKSNHTIASDWSVLPVGTKVRIDGVDGIFVVEDKGGAIKGKHIDMYTKRLADATKWGKQHKNIYIVEE